MGIENRLEKQLSTQETQNVRFRDFSPKQKIASIALGAVYFGTQLAVIGAGLDGLIQLNKYHPNMAVLGLPFYLLGVGFAGATTSYKVTRKLRNQIKKRYFND